MSPSSQQGTSGTQASSARTDRAQFLLKVKSILPAFVLVHFTHHLCTGILIPLLPLIRDDFKLNYSQSGLLVSAFSITYGLSQLPIGSLADRTNKRLILPIGLIGVAVATFILGLSNDYLQALALLIVMGVFGGTYHPIASPLISHFFSKESRGGALGLHLVGGSSSFLVTPVLAGLIAQAAGWRTSFLVLALPAIIASFVFLLVVRRDRTEGEEMIGETAGPAPSWLEIVRLIGVLVAIAMVSSLISSGINSFLPLYLVDKHGVAPSIAAMVVGLTAGAGILGAPAGGALSDRIGRKAVILFSVAGSGPLLFLLTVVPFGVGLIVVIVLFGLVMTARMPVMESLIMDVVPIAKRSTVLGAYFFLTQEVGGLAAMVVGFLMDLLGLSQVFTIMALLAVASSGLVVLIGRKA